MKYLYSLILSLMLILGMGCGLRDNSLYYYIHAPNQAVIPLKSYHIYVDREFGEADKVSIMQAVEQWNFALNGYIKIDIVEWNFQMLPSQIKEGMENNGWFFLKIDSHSKFLPDTKIGKIVLAYCDKILGTRMFMIRDRMGNEDVQPIVLHEIGHLLGAEHVGHQLMYPYYGKERFRCVDWESINFVARQQHLDVNNLNYCIQGASSRSGE